ncbi:MAG: ATP-binding cassette domain-containing protein [Hyphomicrobiaceae bacterium]|nr:MAG: ATP-binding cassette domain-containing protein [Hyphomicrobiaceae bacterium]
MNRPHDISDGRPTLVEAATNAVREQQRRLAAEFASMRSDPPAAPSTIGPFESLLCAVLTSVGWRGEQHRIFEALPHVEPISSFRTLRSVLARLDVDLIPIERGPAELSREDYPCLVVGSGDNCRLLTQGDDRANRTPDEVARRLVRGAVYLIRPNRRGDSAASRPSGGYVGHVLKRMRGSLIRIAGYSAAINALGLVLSLYVLLVYDIVIATKSLDTLAFLAMGALVALAVELRLRHARSEMLAYLAARFDGAVSVHTLASVLNLPLPLTERAPIASQLSRFRQFEIGRELFAGNFASALFDLPFTVLYVVMVFLIGGLLGFVPIGLSLLIVIVCALTATVSIARNGAVGADKLKSDALLFELTSKLRTIRNASAEHIWLTRYAESLATYQRSRFASLQLGLCLQSITSSLVAFAGIVTLGVGALRVMDGAMSLGALIASMMIVWRVLVPIQIVSLNIARLKQTLSTVRQINEVARMRTERESEMPPTLSRRLNGHISASGVYLSLAPQSEPQLRGVNLQIKPGEIVAIAGPSGSGKSTLLKVILGLYPQYIGTLRLDGLDLHQLDPAEVRAAIGYASQQPAFFYGSIAANFRFASPSASDADIREALAAVGISLPHPALPDGLATPISSSESRSLSQGFLCRLSVARALVKKPTILLLDDPGNGLDRVGDAAFIDCLEALKGHTTVLLVTARPSHMRVADRVIEMRGGVIAAEGTPVTMVPRILAQITAAA